MKKTISVLLCLTLVLSTFAGMFCIPASAADTPATYQVFDFEEGDSDGATAIAKSGYDSTQSNTTTDVISGQSSWKISFSTAAAKYNDGAALKLGNFDTSKTYRVSGKYRVLSGTAGTIRVINAASDTNFDHIFTTSNIGSRLYNINDGQKNASTTVYTFSANITPTNAGRILLATKPASGKTAEVIFDDIIVAEIVDTPTVVTDTTKGTATVVNKSGKSDYAAGETAVFTATPNAGYAFSHWTDATGATVSNLATYEHTLTGATTLTAHFALAGVKTFDFEEGDSDGATAIAKSGYDSTQSNTTTDVISGQSSWKISFPNSSGTTSTNGAALKLGNFDTSKTYRVSGKYRILSGTLGTTRVINAASDTNFSHIFSPDVTAPRLYTINDIRSDASTTVHTFSANITPTNAGRILLATKPANNSTVEVIFDDITVAEIVTAPSVSADAAMGSATVINKLGHSDYAVGETAVFTAKPERGYRFIGWENTSGIVSTAATYEVAMNGGDDFNLTAKFEKVNLQTAWNNAVAVRKADASSTGKQGMRVYNSIDKTVGDAAEEYGSIAIRKDYLTKVQGALQSTNGFDLALYEEFEAYKAENNVTGSAGFGRGVSYKTEKVARKTWDETDTEYGFTSYLTEINKDYYDDIYLVRSYMLDSKGNVTYGDIYEASVFNTVYNILQQETEGDGFEAARAIIAEAGQDTYDAWVEANYGAE